MKKNFYFLLFIGVLIFSLPAFGQKTVIVVEPDAGIEIGALNKAVKAVELSGVPDNTIFELKRDGIYLLNGTISHSGYTLHIRTEDGAGSKAVIQPGVDETGASAKQFEPSGDLILERVYILGRDEIGGLVSQPINVSADSCRILIDDCVLDYSDQSLIRTGSSRNVIIVKNSILRNCLRPDNPSNGRIIDTRGNPNDTLWISDCTIYNNGATQLRSDGGAVHFANFDHNTVFATSFNHNMALDYMFKVKITNNLFYNFLYRGNNTSHDPMFRCDSIYDNMTGILGYTNADRFFDLSNNNWFVDDSIGQIMREYGPYYSKFYSWDTEHLDTIWYQEEKRTQWFANDYLLEMDPESTPDMIRFIENGQVDTTGLFREQLEFINPPPLNLDFWKFYTENGWKISGMNPPNPFADENPLVLGEVQSGAFDFGYNGNSRSATAADDGGALGASRWGLFNYPTSLKDFRLNLNNGVSTFPNPFENDVVTFKIDSRAASTIDIRVFDLLGKELQRLNGKVHEGENLVEVNLDKITFSGIYLYKIEFETSNGEKSVSSGKIIKK